MTTITDEELGQFRVECSVCNQSGILMYRLGGGTHLIPCPACSGKGVYQMKYVTCPNGHSMWLAEHHNIRDGHCTKCNSKSQHHNIHFESLRYLQNPFDERDRS